MSSGFGHCSPTFESLWIRTEIRETLFAMLQKDTATELQPLSAAGGMPSLRQSAFSAIDFRSLRELVRMEDVLCLLEFRAVARHGDQLRGPCPVHRSTNETSRSFSVNPSKGVYRCFSPCCGSKGNQLDLYAAATKLPLLEAAHELCNRLGLPPPPLPPR